MYGTSRIYSISIQGVQWGNAHLHQYWGNFPGHFRPQTHGFALFPSYRATKILEPRMFIILCIRQI